MKYNLLILLLVIAARSGRAQDSVRLYSGNIPNSRLSHSQPFTGKAMPGLIYTVRQPQLEIYLPPQGKASGAAVIICPGGSYKVLVYQSEGVSTAKALANKGIAAFVLRYRLPDDSTMTDKQLGPLQDAQQAIKLVRENAARWHINPNRIGIMGFSAGGHLASTAATHFQHALIDNPEGTSLRPDFLILVYPVISMQNRLTHADSRANLLGRNPSQATIDAFSNELQVDAHTPPAYLTHAGDDRVVDVDNSIAFYESLRHHQVPAELHVYPHGGHGFVLAQRPEEWMLPLFTWMKKLQLISE